MVAFSIIASSPLSIGKSVAISSAAAFISLAAAFQFISAVPFEFTGRVIGIWFPKVNVGDFMMRKDRAVVFSGLRILALLTMILIVCYIHRRILDLQTR